MLVIYNIQITFNFLSNQAFIFEKFWNFGQKQETPFEAIYEYPTVRQGNKLYHTLFVTLKINSSSKVFKHLDKKWDANFDSTNYNTRNKCVQSNSDSGSRPQKSSFYSHVTKLQT